MTLSKGDSEYPESSAKSQVVRTKHRLLRRKAEARLLNFLSLTKKIPVGAPKHKSRNYNKLATSHNSKKLGRYSAETDPPSDFQVEHTESNIVPLVFNNPQLSSTKTMSSSESILDNTVLKWYSQLIPILDISNKKHSAVAIKAFMERVRHVCKTLDDTQQQTLLYTIVSRMSNDVIQKLKQ